jgi:class 3 adenylate cyclase
VERPDVRYTWSGDFSIAYEVVGDGPSEVLYLPYWMSNVDLNRRVAPLAAFLEGLASFARTIVMDRRGVGCSDRFAPGGAATLEEMVDDVLAVAAAAHCGNRTFLFGGQETGFVAMLAAAAHPDRFSGLILFGASPAFQALDDVPWQWSDDQFAAQVAGFERATGATELAEWYVRNALPSLVRDRGVIREIATLMANSQAVGASLAELRKFEDLDMRELLRSISVPTLVLHRVDDVIEPIESGRYLAEHIPGARLVELEGRDTQPWAGEPGPVLEEIREFVTGTRGVQTPERRIATILFTDIVGSTQRAVALGDAAWGRLLADHHDVVRGALDRHRGQEVDTAGDGFLAVFDGPARAVECARAIVHEVRALGIEVRTGCHTGEIEFGGLDLHGLAVHIGARIAALAGPSETLVSSTVHDLVAGSGLTFEDAGEHELKGVPDRWRLYRVTS